MKLVLISDTHGMHRELTLPDGDILIHAGDITAHGDPDEVADLDSWFGTLPHRYKILIAGNHDFFFENQPGQELFTNAIYLQDSATIIEGIKFYGSPWQPRFFDWAFNLDRGQPLQEKWALIPADTDVLITHGPPFGFGDTVKRGLQVGCEDLLNTINQIKPRLHVFGHIHEGYGLYENPFTTFANASTCTLKYKPSNEPLIYKWEV